MAGAAQPPQFVDNHRPAPNRSGEQQQQHASDDDVGMQEQADNGEGEGDGGGGHRGPLPGSIRRAASNSGASEPLAEAGAKGAARTELRGADPDAGAVADLTDRIKDVNYVETAFVRAVSAGFDRSPQR